MKINREGMRTGLVSSGRLLAGAILLASATTAQAEGTVVEYAVIANPASGVTSLTMKDLARVFKCEDQYWKGKKNLQVKLVLPSGSSEEMKVARDKIYKMDEKAMKKYWVEMIYQNKIASRPKEFPSSKLLVRMVAKEDGGISIVKASDVSSKDGVVILKVDGIAPGEKGYSITQAGGTVSAVMDMGDLTVEDLAADLPVSELAADSAPVEAASPRADDETDERMDQLENDLLDLQLEILGGGSDEDPFAAGPLLQVKGFGHVTFFDNDSDDETDQTTAFALGGLDLFIISQLSEKLSFLNETVFEPTDDGEYILDVERVILKYSVSDALSISAGRFHTTLGYWNDAYHHGEWLQTSIGRPAVVRFEDDGGMLPVHMIGLVLKGAVEAGESDLDWTVEVGNGRGADPDPPQITTDANDSKAINLNVGFQPSGLAGLRVGGGAYVDRIPGGGTSNHNKTDEVILSAYAVYHSSNWEVMAEYFDVSHDEQGVGDSNSQGYYTQLAYKMDEWTPYLRYDVSDLADTDTFFASTDDTETIAGGIRYDYEAWSALKLQYGLTTTDPSGGGASIDSSSLEFQVSFAF